MFRKLKPKKNFLFLMWFWPISFFFYDFISKTTLYTNYTSFFYKYAIAFKATILLIIFTIFYIKKLKYHLVNNFFLKAVICLAAFFLIGHFFILKHLTKDSLNYSLYYFLNSVIPILIIPLYYYSKNLLNKTLEVFLKILTTNTFFIVLGIIFNIDFFESYFRSGGRFGYMGFLLYHWEAGYLYFIAAYVSYEKYLQTKQKQYLFFFVILFCSLFLLGTKKGVFLGILYFIFLIINNYKTLIKYYKTTLILIVSALSFSKIIFIKIFKDNLELFSNIYQKNGFLTAFSSHRSDMFQEKFIPVIVEKWNAMNYFFGGALFSEYKSELEIVDVFMCFGFFGLVVYLQILKRIVVNKKIFLLTIMLLIAAVFSGNFFSSINVVTFYFISVVFLDCKKMIMIYK